jgi:hypothetical protein
MVIIANVAYPSEHSTEVGKRLLKLPPLPSYMTIKGPFVIGDVGVGIKVTTIFEFDQTKTAEAMEFVGNRYAQYIGVPGFTYNVAIWFEIKEALKMVGIG